MPALSFTGERQLRFPAPDVARGFMLALIALANVPWWLKYFPDYPTNRSELLQVMNAADQWWFIVRSLFVDRRAYPLFSILFGAWLALHGDHGNAHHGARATRRQGGRVERVQRRLGARSAAYFR